MTNDEKQVALKSAILVATEWLSTHNPAQGGLIGPLADLIFQRERAAKIEILEWIIIEVPYMHQIKDKFEILKAGKL